MQHSLVRIRIVAVHDAEVDMEGRKIGHGRKASFVPTNSMRHLSFSGSLDGGYTRQQARRWRGRFRVEKAPHMASVVIVDIEKFSARPDTVQAELRRMPYELIQQALISSGLGSERVDREDRGDAIMLFFHHASPVRLLVSLVGAVDDGLRRYGLRYAELYRMRLRMTVHHGLIEPDENGWVGTTINEAARLVDAPAVRAGLIEHPEAWLALIVGDKLYQSVLATGYIEAQADEWAPMEVTVKDFKAPAWIRVPGVRADPTRPSAAEPSPSGSARTRSGAVTPDAGGPHDASTPPVGAPTRIGNQILGNPQFHGPTTFVGGDQHVHGTGPGNG